MGRNRVETVTTEGAEATQVFAAKLASTLTANTLIALFGDLGAGKTTFLQGLVRGLGGEEEMVQSPTFVYLHQYPASLPVFHFDLYRLPSPQDFLAMGFEETFDQGGIVAIEWPERIASLLPKPHLKICLKSLSETKRHLSYGWIA